MKILVNRTDAIGDTLLSTPLARFLKTKIPHAEIAFIVSPRSGELIKLCEGVDLVYILDLNQSSKEKENFLNSIFDEFSPDKYFHLGGSFIPTKIAFKRGIPWRGGLKSRLKSFLYLNKGIRQSRTKASFHEGHYNLLLAKDLVGLYDKGSWEDFRPQIKVDLEKGRVYLEELGFKKGQIPLMIHPGMSGHTLNWNSEFYGELLVELLQKYKERLFPIISFTPSDAPYLEGLRKVLGKNSQFEGQVKFFDGSKRGLIHYAHLLSQAKLFIGPSTGTLHMANSMNIPTLGLYSPIKAQSEKRWGPYSKIPPQQVFFPRVECPATKKCNGPSCPFYECMATIKVSDLFQAAQEILGS